MDAERKRAEAARAEKVADRLECEAWCGALLFGLDVVRSPTIAQALNAGFDAIEIQCQRCRRMSLVPLAKIKRPPDTELWKLEPSLICQPCRDDLEALKPKRGFRSRTQALITGLHLAQREPDPPDDPQTPSAAKRAGRAG
ncbi:hypothetical protein X566_20260 [Afipia sp. P52-10]|nr:hypothetical protein X566_20260 [Afipia sp. P52-10]